MFRTPELRRFAYYSQPNWPGGIYATPTILGSRSGATVAGCWAAMMFMGRSGYVHATRTIVAKQREMVAGIKEIDGLFVVGEPVASVYAFGSKKTDIYRYSEGMSKRGWALSPCQFPPAVHCTVVFRSDAEKFVADLKEVHAEIAKEPSKKPSGSAAFYGLSATIPDRTVVDRFARGYCDALYIPYIKYASSSQAAPPLRPGSPVGAQVSPRPQQKAPIEASSHAALPPRPASPLGAQVSPRPQHKAAIEEAKKAQ